MKIATHGPYKVELYIYSVYIKNYLVYMAKYIGIKNIENMPQLII